MRLARLALAAALCAPLTALATDVQGNVVAGVNDHWTAAGSPYRLVGDVTVPAGVTLTIDAGVTVSAPGGDTMGSGTSASLAELIVSGTLHVDGTSTSGVTFTAANPGAWYGIELFAGAGATIQFATVENASYGIDAAASFSATDSTLRSNGTALHVTGGATATITRAVLTANGTAVNAAGATANVDHSLVTAQTGSYAVEYNSQSLGTLDHDTVEGNSGTGVYVYGNSGTAVTLQNSIVVSNGGYGVYRSTTGGTLSLANDDVWSNTGGNFGGYAGAGSASLDTNPLFVSPTNLRLTSNSPARFSSTDGSDMGALAYASDPTGRLTGNLWQSTTLSGSATVTGDLYVPNGVTLTIAAGTRLTLAASDEMAANTDPAHVEIIVGQGGSLVVNGTAASRAVFAAATDGACYGLEQYGGTVSIANAVFAKCSYGLDQSGGTSSLTGVTAGGDGTGLHVTGGGSLTFSSGTISGCGTALNAAGATANVDHTLIYANTGSYAVEYNSQALGTLDHDTVVANSGTGVYAYGNTGSNVTLENSLVTSNGGYGVYRSTTGGTLSLANDDVWSNTGGNFGGYAGAGSASLDTNPLYAGAASFNYALTSNSPARFSSTDGSDMGALPYAGVATGRWTGNLWQDATMSGTVTITGDLYVPPNVTLTIAPGTVVTFAATDEMAANTSASQVELIVGGGNLSIPGPSAVAMNAAAAGACYGVELYSGALIAANLSLPQCSYGLDQSGGTATLTGLSAGGTGTALRVTGGTLGLSGGTFSGNGTVLNVSNATANVDHVLVVNNTGSYALQYNSQAKGTLDHDTIASNSGTGVYVYGNTGTSVTLSNLIVASNGGYGVYRSTTGGTLGLDNDDVWSNTGGNYGGYAGAGTASLSTNPLFVSASDYHLQVTSPCRGAGTGGSDLGAYPYQTGPVDHVVVSPATATVAGNGKISFTATAYDASNAPVPSATFTWTAKAAAGTIDAAGTLTAACTAGAVPAGVTATESSGKSGTADVTITAGPAAQVAVTPPSVSLGAGATQQMSAQVTDACGNAVGGSVTWSVSAGAGTISAGGLYTAPCAPGSYAGAIRATSGSIAGTADAAVAAGALASLSVQPQDPTVPRGGQQQFTAAGADACGNAVAASPAWSVAAGGGTIDSSGLFTAGATAGTFPGTIVASSGGVSASTGVTVAAPTIASLTVTPQSATLAPGQTQIFTATAKDSSGNPVTVATTWSLAAAAAGTLDAQSGLFTAGNAAATYTGAVEASAGGLVATATVVVKPGPAAVVTVTPASATLAPGGSTTFSAQQQDAFGNASTDPVAWSVANAAAGAISSGGYFTAAATPGGFPNAVVATAGSASGTASITIQAGALSQLVVAPAAPQVRVGGSVAFSATGKDANGNDVAVTPTWAVVQGGGAISANGVFTAGTVPGTYADTVQAQANGLAATATVIVTPGPVVQLAVTPAHPSLAAGASQQFAFKATDAFGNEVTGVAPTWSALPAAGTITQGGLFTAGRDPGDYAAAVSAQASGIAGTASVQITGGGADGGSDGGVGPTPPATTKGGCGCGGGTAGLAALLLLPLAALRRRRTA